ncbi:MAG: hypothetical protein AB7V19_05205 [Candidatus Bipolaricaulia bacterium]
MARAGFDRAFVRGVLLPDWWDDALENDPSVLQDVEIRVARFLGASVAAVGDPAASLTVPTYPRAQLRRVRDVSRRNMGPAIHTAIEVAKAVVRSLPDASSHNALPPDGLTWRGQMAAGPAVTLNVLASNLWSRGIPVVPLESLPSPGFQAIACEALGRSVILLGHKYDAPGRVAYLVAHEAGHIAHGDCSASAPVIDEEDEIADDSPIESAAELYATTAIVGSTSAPELPLDASRDSKALATDALELERRTGAEASLLIFNWARQTLDYATAMMAVRALYRERGARQLLAGLCRQHLDLEHSSVTDRELLRCVFGLAADDDPAP